MANIQFSIGDSNYALYKKAKSNFNSKSVPTLSEAEIIELFSKMLAIEEADDSETERDLKEEMGWYDEDSNKSGSRLNNFLHEESTGSRKKRKRKSKKVIEPTNDDHDQVKLYLQELSRYVTTSSVCEDDLQTIIARRPKSLTADYVMKLIMSATLKHQ